MNEKKYHFPEDFLFGTATSAYQIEGHNYNNDWYEFEQNRPRFGLVYINYETLERTMKESGHLSSKICKKKAIF